MRRVILAIACACVWLNVLGAESRFGRPVIKVADPKSYRYFKLDDNNFPVLDRGDLSVTCMTYRGLKRYYVEVAVMNRSEKPLGLNSNFVTFSKPGYSSFMSATDVWASVAGAFVPTPPPPPTRATTTYSGTAQSYGNVTELSGTATTSVDNSAAGWHALGQALAARSYNRAQSREQGFAEYLVTFAHERQDLTVPPNKVSKYVFTFEQVKRKKAPFVIDIVLGDEVFTFRYKE